MPVAIQMDFADTSLEQYDEVIQKMGFEHGGPGAPGGLFHWVAKTADGIRVVDVWETQAQYDEFAQTQIGPLTAAVGIAGPPTIQTFPIYNILTKG